MKQTILFALSVFFALTTNAQNYIQEGMVWHTAEIGTHDPMAIVKDVVTVVKGDTLVGQTPAFKVYTSVDAGPEALAAVVRQEDEKVFFWHHATQQWVLGYDFGLAEGEGIEVGTVRDLLSADNSLPTTYVRCVKVGEFQAVDQVTGNNVALPALYVEEYESEKCETKCGEGIWLKCIGSTAGFLWNNYFDADGVGAVLLLDICSGDRKICMDATSGIAPITEPGVGKTDIFDLQGRKCCSTTPGQLYIVNGKKVIAH